MRTLPYYSTKEGTGSFRLQKNFDEYTVYIAVPASMKRYECSFSAGMHICECTSMLKILLKDELAGSFEITENTGLYGPEMKGFLKPDEILTALGVHNYMTLWLI